MVIPKPVPVPDKRIPIQLSVEQLGAIIRLLYENNAFGIANKTELIELIADSFSTTKQFKINAGSLRNHFNAPVPKTLDQVCIFMSEQMVCRHRDGRNNMESKSNLSGINMAQAVSIASFIIGFVTIWIHLEIRIAEINVDLTNLKQDMIIHKTDNRKDMEILRNENNNNTKAILEKVDEIQIYLRNKKN
jgi:hypothetical protein